MTALPLVTALLALAPQDTADPPPSRRIGEHSSPILQLALSPDRSELFTAAQGEICGWDLKKDRPLWKTKIPPLPVVTLGVGDDLVAFSSGFAAAQLIERESGEKRTGIGGTTATQRSSCMVIDPKDRWIWMGTEGGMVMRVVPDSVSSWSNWAMDNQGVTSLAMDARGKTLVVGGRDGTLRFVGAKSARRDDKKVLEGHRGAVTAVVMDPKGSTLVSGSELGDLRVWKFSSGKSQHVLEEHEAAIRRLAVDAKGRRFASGDAYGMVKVWDLKQGELLLTLPDREQGAVTGLAFLGKGETLATTWEAPQVTLWDLSEL